MEKVLGGCGKVGVVWLNRQRKCSFEMCKGGRVLHAQLWLGWDSESESFFVCLLPELSLCRGGDILTLRIIGWSVCVCRCVGILAG